MPFRQGASWWLRPPLREERHAPRRTSSSEMSAPRGWCLFTRRFHRRAKQRGHNRLHRWRKLPLPRFRLTTLMSADTISVTRHVGLRDGVRFYERYPRHVLSSLLILYDIPLGIGRCSTSDIFRPRSENKIFRRTGMTTRRRAFVNFVQALITPAGRCVPYTCTCLRMIMTRIHR